MDSSLNLDAGVDSLLIYLILMLIALIIGTFSLARLMKLRLLWKAADYYINYTGEER
jgi:hypothetical protein